MFQVLIVGLALIVGVNSQCAGVQGPCIGGTCPAGYFCDGTNCCPNSATTTVSTVTSVTSSISTSVGACIGGLCPTGYTCDTTTNLCYLSSTTTTTGCVGPCIGGSCPTGYTCNTTTSQCCSSTTTNTTCVDKKNAKTGVSDCPSRSFLCNNTVYYTLMTDQCPKTCNRCSSSTNSTSSSCVDRTNPTTGVSDCPSLSYLCNVTAYYTLMTTQCPSTCGRCTSG